MLLAGSLQVVSLLLMVVAPNRHQLHQDETPALPMILKVLVEGYSLEA